MCSITGNLDSKPVSIGSILLLDGRTVVLLKTDRDSEAIVRVLYLCYSGYCFRIFPYQRGLGPRSRLPAITLSISVSTKVMSYSILITSPTSIEPKETGVRAYFTGGLITFLLPIYPRFLKYEGGNISTQELQTSSQVFGGRSRF